MPRKVALLAALACLAFAAPASADVVANNDPDAVAGALADPLGSPNGDFTAFPDTSNSPSGVGSGALAGFPRSGATYGVLSTGNADYFTTGIQGSGSSTTVSIADQVTLVVPVTVPATANCLRLDFRFFSLEDKDSTFSDTFLAELDQSTFSVDEGTGAINAPQNFAGAADGPISVTSGAFVIGDNGTAFPGATPLMTASVPVTPGSHPVYLTIFDRNDSIVDSAVLLDALRLESSPVCTRGAAAAVQPDTTAPAVSIASPANGSTITGAPTYSGSAGDAPGDGAQVTVRTTSSNGATVEAVATRNGTGWSVGGAALAPGTYTAVAFQGDASGNTGQSAPVTFSVGQQQTGPPPPQTGKAVNVAVVKGKVRIRRPGGKFVELDDASQIPTGSTIDTRKGTVALTSTAGSGKTQKANFFDGLFKVTQTRGKKPLTNLTLNEPLAKCSTKKKAKSSAKKKRKRRLWGDGKGNFRTSGRRSAATVAGTKWLVEDTCKGTLTRVARGVVKVRDYKKKKTVRVKAGKKYMAR